MDETGLARLEVQVGGDDSSGAEVTIVQPLAHSRESRYRIYAWHRYLQVVYKAKSEARHYKHEPCLN